MATHKSALKRIRQNEKRRLINRSVRRNLRSRIKLVSVAIEEKDFEKARETLAQAIPVIDKAGSKGIIHKRNAARKISRLTQSVNALKA
ncbi:MAG: 30S ribosomal protein S20 [Pseudomonadota bacterium]